MNPPRPGAMPKPCPAALAAFGVPAKRWATRTDLLQLLERGRLYLENAPCGTPIENAANEARLSPFHFAHRFRETFGQTPAQFHRDSLIKRAKAMLPSLSVSEVAVELGYQSISAFVRAFKRETGVTPGRWTKSA